WPLLVAVKTPINRAVYRENHREGLKKPSRLQVMANSWGFCGLFPAKINRERISKEQGKQARITGKAPVISPCAAKPARSTYATLKIKKQRRTRLSKFRKGVSGNPRGRPKGSKNLTTLIMDAARDQVSVVIDGQPRKISALQATVAQLASKAARGDQKAMVEFLDRIAEIEGRVRPSEYPLGEQDVDVLRAAYERMKQCAPDA